MSGGGGYAVRVRTRACVCACVGLSVCAHVSEGDRGLQSDSHAM
jgi:hypothetical protein